MAVLLITATAYDIKLARDVRRSRQRVANMASAENVTSTSDLKLDLNGLDVSLSKGKSMPLFNII